AGVNERDRCESAAAPERGRRRQHCKDLDSTEARSIDWQWAIQEPGRSIGRWLAGPDGYPARQRVRMRPGRFFLPKKGALGGNAGSADGRRGAPEAAPRPLDGLQADCER